MDRRSFIKTGLGTVGSLFVFGPTESLGSEAAARFALLADTHIPADVQNNYRGFYPYQNLQKVVPDVASSSPDAAVIAGDLARLTGEPGDYVNLKKLLEPLVEKTPVFMALGNHDNRENFLKTFEETAGQKRPVSGKHVAVINKGPVRFILLDSLLYSNKVPGLLGKAQRQWLENYLRESDNTATILCFHHTLGDGDGDLLDVLRLYRMIEPMQKVKAIVYGHSHVYGFSQFEGIHLINLPAVGYNFNDRDPVGWVEANLTANGGDFTLHAVAGNTDANSAVTKLTWR
ncbi:MAG: metallophosphoesterase [Phycisphaerales bacterium]|nr:MAG: metallophosphoesterase [Phycisphaerales bacterium]